MSVSSTTIDGVLEAFSDSHLRTNNPKTCCLRTRRREALRGHRSATVRRALVRGFLEAAVDRFAEGEMRKGRRFYDGAFAFAGKRRIRRVLLKVCIARSQRAFAEDDHAAVWRLLSIACWYPPQGFDVEAVKHAFARAGVLQDELDLPVEDGPLWDSQAHILPSVIPVVV